MKSFTCSPCLLIKLTATVLFVGLFLMGQLGANAEPASLGEALDARKAEFAKQAPPELSTTFEQGIRDVAADDVMETAKRKGDKAPDFTLPHATGEQVTLSELLKQGPVVLTWYRGGWCPYCNIQLHYLQKKLPAFKAEDATLVAISPELPDKSLDTRQKNGLDFYVLSDSGNTVAEAYGIKYTLPPEIIEAFKGRLDVPAYNGDDTWTLPLSVTYIVDTDGTIAWAYINEDYRERAEPDDILAELKKL